MSKRTAAGLCALVIWGVNKGATLAGLPHLAPSLVWGLTVVVMGWAATISVAPVSPGNKATQWIVAALAVLGALGVQLVDTAIIPPAPVPVTEVAPAVVPEAAPAAPVAPQPAAPVPPDATPSAPLDGTGAQDATTFDVQPEASHAE